MNLPLPDPRPSGPSRSWLGLLAAGAMSLSLAACGESGPTESPSTTDTAAPEPAVSEKVVLHRGNNGEPSSLDPHRIAGVWESHISRDLFLGLMTDAPDATPIPGAAESHEVSEDGMTYTFTMREGHTWSDGVPVTAEDFVFSFRRILNPETAAEYASIMYVLKNAEAVSKGEMPVEAVGARAVDERTLVLELENPAPYLLHLLTHSAAYPVPKHLLEEKGDAWVEAGTMVTNGAYRLDEWRPNDFVKLVRNEAFYDVENVAIEEVYYYPTDDRAAALRRFRAGELDMNNDFPVQQFSWLEENLPGEYSVHPYILTNVIFLNTAKEPFDNRDIRLAMGMALRREVLTDQIMATGDLPTFAFVPPNISNYPGTAAASFKDLPMEERLAQARVLMEGAGYGPDNPLRFTMRYREGVDNRRLAIAIAAMWKEIFIEAELLNTEVKTHYNDLRSGNYAVADGGWQADFNDAKNYLFLLESRTGYLNYTNYNNPEYDALMLQSDQTLDVEERAALMTQAEQIMLNDMPLIPTHVRTTRNLVGPHVKGFVPNVEDKFPTRWLSIDENARTR